MDQSSNVERSRLPIELQLNIIGHLAQDFRPERSATHQEWARLNRYASVNRAWFDEFAILLAQFVPIADTVQYALSAILIDAVLKYYLRRVEGSATTTTSELDLYHCTYQCLYRQLARSLERVLAARSSPLEYNDQKRIVSIALRERDLVCANILVPRWVSPYNVPIRHAIGSKRLDLLEWMIARGVPVKNSPWSPLVYAMKTCAKDDEATSNSATVSILQLLLDHGAEIGAQELQMLKQRPQFEELLLAKEPRGDTQVCLERMVVHYNRYDHIIDRCLERGADPNISIWGWPLLSRAVQRRSLAVCEQLLKHGAVPEPECEESRSPLYHAVRRIGPGYHDLLVKYGAKPRKNYQPRKKWTYYRDKNYQPRKKSTYDMDDIVNDPYKEEREYWTAYNRMKASPSSQASPANPPRAIHQPTEEENAREQLRWAAVAYTLAYHQQPPSS